MKKETIRKRISQAIDQVSIVNVYMIYNENYYNLVPLKASKKLFLAIDEDDFIFDGYRISRFRDVLELRIKDDKCDEIVRNEGLFDHLHTPEIDVEDWQTVFNDLKSIGKNVIVEYETPEGKDDTLTIGKIAKVYKDCLYMYSFDADGIWAEEPCRIPYSEVTSVTFDSRYVTVFSKYIDEAPDIHKD
jgi:hypothetical protein